MATSKDPGTDAGRDSPHLDRGQKEQAASHATPDALVIHEVIRDDGERELGLKTSGILWSGLAAGMSMGFSFLVLGFLHNLLGDEGAARVITPLGYTVGFVITILGRQELYTETTLSAMLPFLMRRDVKTGVAVLRFWVTVLIANLAGTLVFAAFLAYAPLLNDGQIATFNQLATAALGQGFGETFAKSLLAGWLIALMAWLLPNARSGKFFVILFLTYVVALGQMSHVVAGSVEAGYAVFRALGTWPDYFLKFLAPTLLGNTVGGVLLVALLNHAPVSSEIDKDGDGAAR